MPSIQRYKVRNKFYYRVVESKRINGKPHAIPIFYIGDNRALCNLVYSCLKGDKRDVVVKSYAHGEVAALVQIIKELELIPIINSFVTKKCKGISFGEAVALLALNRVVEPCSKRSWGNWAKGTSLFKLFPKIKINELTSKFFWEQMQDVSQDVLERIENILVRRVIEKYNLKLDLLFFDTTNCYSYVKKPLDEDSLFQYGHSKDCQYHRRLFGVELLVSRRGCIPIYHNVYPGNKHDSSLFPRVIEVLRERLRGFGIKEEEVTLVFDRGILSRRNFERLDSSGLGFVTALRLGDIPRELFDIPLQKFRGVREGMHKGLPFYSKRVELWGKERLAVFYISEVAKGYQESLLEQQLSSKIKELSDWNEALINQSGMCDNVLDESKVVKKIKSLEYGAYIKDILSIKYNPELPKLERLQFSVNEKAKAEIVRRYFGKRCLITNRLEWGVGEVIDAYFQQGIVERMFELLKDRHHISVRPQFHRSNQNTRVHVFCCFLALLISQILLNKAQGISSEIKSLSMLWDKLSEVRLAAIFSSDRDELNSSKIRWGLEKMSAEAKELFEGLCGVEMMN